QSLTAALAGVWGSPAFWLNNIYYSAKKDYIKEFRVYQDLLSTSPIAQSANSLGYPGSIPSVSANGATNGILWLIDSSAFGDGRPDILYAFDAANVSRELYDSTQAGTRDQAGPAVKYNPPTVANGKVYLGTNGEVDVYGLLP
ncbi:MAG TPA: pyrrolo-quinoline quinone, partial [Terriglobia bacterium]